VAREFTRNELQGLLAFFESPLGERFIRAQPQLLKEQTAETNRVLAPHRAELRDALRKVATHIDSL
jgi:hypothetical protein